MKKHFLFLVLTFACFYKVSAQNFDVRKLTLKSDVILLYNQDSIAYIDDIINDYTTEHYYKLLSVKTMVKNQTNFKFAGNKLRYILEGEDFFKIVEKGDCLQRLMRPYEGKPPTYYGMLFLKKTGKHYNVVGLVQNTDNLTAWQTLVTTIKSVAMLENITNLQDRYTKTMDWFLENDIMPDEGFLKFYHQKGILKTDTAVLTNEQLEKAKTKFFNGNENFLDFLAKVYPNEVSAYYIQVLTNISNQSDYDYGDCLRFQRIVRMLTNDFGENYDDINNGLNNLLTNQLENYEKKPIMQLMLKVVQSNTYKIGTLTSDKL